MHVSINGCTHSWPICWSFVFLNHKWVVTLLALSLQQRTTVSHFKVGGLALWQTEITASKYHMTVVWMTHVGFFLFSFLKMRISATVWMSVCPSSCLLWWLLLMFFQGQNGWRGLQTGQGEGFLQCETQTCNWNSTSLHFLSQLLYGPICTLLF